VVDRPDRRLPDWIEHSLIAMMIDVIVDDHQGASWRVVTILTARSRSLDDRRHRDPFSTIILGSPRRERAYYGTPPRARDSSIAF